MPANIQQPALTGEDDLVAALSESVSEAVNPRPVWSEADAQFLRDGNPDALRMKVGTVPQSPTVVGIDWGHQVPVETPKEMFAREIAAAQSLLDDAEKKQADAKAEYHRRTLEIKAALERVQALQAAQKDNVARIKAHEKAIRVHRQTVFGLQEAGR